MAKYVFPHCPHCDHKNTFDLEELRRRSGLVYKAVERDEEFRVTCVNCRRPFKFAVRGGLNG